jgi:hypothetical protein
MNKDKFTTVEVETESNIAVLRLEGLNEINTDDLKSFFTDKVEPKLVEALTEHFACPVKIRVPANIKTMHPVTVEYIVLVESDSEDYQETVTLNEIWLY